MIQIELEMKQSYHSGKLELVEKILLDIVEQFLPDQEVKMKAGFVSSLEDGIRIQMWYSSGDFPGSFLWEILVRELTLSIRSVLDGADQRILRRTREPLLLCRVLNRRPASLNGGYAISSRL